jgi:hypothetical protein
MNRSQFLQIVDWYRLTPAGGNMRKGEAYLKVAAILNLPGAVTVSREADCYYDNEKCSAFLDHLFGPNHG